MRKTTTPPTRRMEKVDVDALVDRSLKLLRESQHQNHEASNSCRGFNCYHQVFIAVGGTPGSGKSYIAKQVCEAINKRNPNGDASVPEAAVIGMDGYHLSRELLQKKAEQGHEIHTQDGTKNMTYDELMMRRGAPFTYCPGSFINDLKRAKEAGEGSFPVYSREKHDPIPNGVSITKENKIIFVEGLYLLCLDVPEWKPLRDLWDDKWYVDVSEEETKRRLVQRHLKHWDDEKTSRWGGNDEDAAAKKAEANDMQNATFVHTHSIGNANLVVVNETIPEDDSDNVDGHYLQSGQQNESLVSIAK